MHAVLCCAATSMQVRFGKLEFVHGIGGTNGWLFFATPYGSTQRYIVKVRREVWQRGRSRAARATCLSPPPLSTRTACMV